MKQVNCTNLSTRRCELRLPKSNFRVLKILIMVLVWSGTTGDLSAMTSYAFNCKNVDAPANTVPFSSMVVACNDTINGSLDQECKFTLSGGVIFEGNDTTNCPGPWTLVVRFGFFDTLAVGLLDSLNDTVQVRNAYAYLNGFLTIEVIASDGNQCCAPVLRVLDEFPPQLTCTDIIINCNVDTSVANLGAPFVQENCDPNISLSHFDEFVPLPCDDIRGFIGIIERTWIAEDESGNRDTCLQNIFILKADLADVTLDPLVVLDCNVPNADPSITGYPELHGLPLSNMTFCNLWVLLEMPDDTIQGCENASYKLIRTWVIGDTCDVDNQLILDQLIDIRDTTPAVLTCPDTIRLETDPGECWATIILPDPVVMDDCTTNPTITAEIVGIGFGFGPHQMVRPGTYLVRYTALDCSDSLVECTSILIIEDLEEPVAICREFTVISLNSTGVVQVPARSFDEGSYDNCDDVGFLVSRDGVNFLPTATFDCNDIGQDSIMVVLRVYELTRPDVYDHCMVWARVQDKLAPVVLCPPNQTVDCGTDFSDLSIFGSPTIIEACAFTRQDSVVFDLDLCGTGTVKRIFIATDSSGNRGMCMQTITVSNLTPFNGMGIIWPRDTTFTTCNPSISPNDLAPPYNRPVLPADTCAMLAVNYRDEQFTTSFPACFKVFRHWTVLDWCTNNQWKYTQKIIVMDVEKPTLTCPSTITEAVSSVCDKAFVSIMATNITDCDPGVVVTNNSPYALSGGADASGEYPLGNTNVIFTAKDRCGNVSVCTTRVIVRDLTPPTPKIVRNLAIELGSFNGVVQATLFAKAWDVNSYDNCTLNKNLKFTIREYNPMAGVPATTPSITYTCSDVGKDTVEVWVMDEAGHSDFAIGVVDVQDNNNLCSGTRPSISGYLKTESGNPVAHAKVWLTGSENWATTSDENGFYEFSDLTEHGNYSVRAEKTDDLLDGVTTFDLVLLGKHVLNMDPLSSPYKVLASDANNSKSVSTMDVIALRKAILKVENEFPNCPSWRFLDEKFQFSNPQHPFQQPIPTLIQINDLTQAVTQANFMAVKIGDLNGNATGNPLQGVDNRSLAGKLTLLTEDLTFEKGEEVEVILKVKETEWMIGFQFSLGFDTGVLSLTDWEDQGSLDGLSKENFGWKWTETGNLPVSWHRFRSAGVEGGQALFSLKFKALESGKLSDVFGLRQEPVVSEVYDDLSKEVKEIILEFESERAGDAELPYELFQNKPNPFDQSTSIGFSLPETDKITFTVFDFSGREIKKLSGEYTAGYHEIILRKDDLPQNGVYYYQIETQKFTATKKMIRL